MVMPLYNQTDNSLGSYWLPNGGSHSMLCGPTSAAMSLASQVYYAGTVNTPQGWTASSFVPKTWQQRVQNMASLVGCSPTGGTMYWPWLTNVGESNGVAGRAGDFKLGADDSASFWPEDVQGQDIEPYTQNRNSTVLIYGHYYRNDNNVLGTDFVTFSRNGGHVIAVSGFIRNGGGANNDTFVINDPWGGVYQWYKMLQIQGGFFWTRHTGWFGIPYWTLDSVVTLPVVGSQAGYLIHSGTYYGIMEAHTNLGVH
jgi:hypothetical protein